MSLQRWKAPAIVVFWCALVVSTSGCTRDAAAPAEAPRPALVAVATADGALGAGYPGIVRARERAVLSVTVPGRITQVSVDLGQPVRRGQALISLDTAPLDAAVRSAQAALARADAASRDATARRNRARAAAESGAASPTEIHGLDAEAEAADAAAVAARAALADAVWRREQAQLRSPIDGVVAARHVEPGQAIGEGSPAIEIDGTGREVVVDLPTDLNVVVGAAVQLAGARGSAPGTITHLNERLGVAGIRRAVIEAPDTAQVGDVWAVRPATGDGEVYVPLRAVRRDTADGPQHVLKIVADDGRVARVTVVVGEPAGDAIAVREGLVAGDRVVIAGAGAITDGDRVKPVFGLR